MTSVYEKKISAEVRLIHCRTNVFTKFHHFKEKTIDTDEDQTTQVRHFKSIGIYWFS